MKSDTQPVAISVIVPVGGVDAALREQVAALEGQVTDHSFEVVLACNADDRSALTSLQSIARSAGSGWRAVEASARRGPAYARNVGVGAASGTLLLFCDADDVVVDGWVEAMVGALRDADAVTGPLPPFGPPGALAARPAGAQDDLPTYMGVPYLPSGNLGIRREAFDAVGGFDERLQTSEDIAFSWSLQVAGFSIAWSPGSTINRRYRGGMWPMLRQHFRYGRGISRVLLWYGIPGDDGFERPGWRMLRANQGSGSGGARTRNHRDVLRRGALASGRLIGAIEVAARRTGNRNPSQ